MKNILWVAALVLAFIAGYFSHDVNQNTSTTVPQTISTQKANNVEDSQLSSEQLRGAAKTIFSEKEKLAVKAVQHQNTIEPQITSGGTPQVNNNPAQTADTNNPAVNKYPNEISDEEIDKVIPVPFNEKLKHNHGELREKYKDFVAATQQLDWDKNMQNKLSDAILGNPYTKFITVESLQCKANLCEIRLYETKEGAWSLIMAEMRLQDWWDIGGSSASGFGTDTPSKMGWYVLLPRR